MKVVVIASGGLDSSTLAYDLAAQGREVTLLSVDYGQKHRRELRSAEMIAQKLGASWVLLDLRNSGIEQVLGASALTDEDVDVPDGHYAAENMRATVVPNRNAIFLAFAYARAVAVGAQVVAMAVHSGDHPIYPDCRPEFIRSFESMEAEALADIAAIKLEAPYVNKTKADIVRLGAEVGVPFELTWSCYKGGDIHCGSCGTCVERREAFSLANVNDPTSYVAQPHFEAP